MARARHSEGCCTYRKDRRRDVGTERQGDTERKRKIENAQVERGEN